MKTLLPFFTLALAAPGLAQIVPFEASGLAMGHVHLNVSDIEAQTRFWIDVFGAKPLKRPDVPGVSVPGMLILFNRQPPGHASESTVLDHFGFKVRSRDEMVARCRAAGFEISRLFTGSEGFPNAYVIGPDGLKVEMQEDASLPVLARAQHLHYILAVPAGLRAWYIDTFPMEPTTRGPYGSADIPGMNLTFAPIKGGADRGPIKPTKGGVIDHIGFEVRDLEAFCRKLESSGAKFDVPYQRIPSLGIASAFLTDPKGVYIELTEGLRAY